MADEVADVTASRFVYITNLSYRTQWHSLKDFIRENVTEEAVYVDIPVSKPPKGTGGKPKSRGVAIVEFPTLELAARAIEKMNGKDLDGRDINVRYDNKPHFNVRNVENPEAIIFINGLPYSTTWYDLKDLCREYGEVQHADIMMGSDGRSKGSGVVYFKDTESATTAIAGLNNTTMNGRTIYVRVFTNKAVETQQ